MRVVYQAAALVSLFEVVTASAAMHSVPAPQSTCPSNSPRFELRLPNYNPPTNLTYAWDPAPNAPAGAVYEVVRDSASDYCSLVRTITPTVIFTTTGTSYSASSATVFPQLNLTYGIWVRLQSDPCTASTVTWVDDTFTAPPTKPPVPQMSVGNGAVTATFTYNDFHTFGIGMYRTGSDGLPQYAGFAFTCGTSSMKSITDYGPGGSATAGGKLANGVYSYRLLVSNNINRGFGSNAVYSDPVTVVIGPPITLAINSFTATPTTIRLGQSATLSWSVTGAAGIAIDNGVGTLPASGSATVKPAQTTTYTLSAMQGATTVTATVTIEVLTTPVINVVALPLPMLQPANTASASTTYALTNSGGTDASITLAQNGDFFTQTPSSFTLTPGATKSITITAKAQPTGVYEGASLPSGTGVPAGLQIPVRLLSAAPPTGPVTADPSANRVDVAGSATTNPTGSVGFTNRGTATLTGILSSDVPWIIPQSGIVTIAAGQTVTLTFAVDRSKRPDATTLIGSAEGGLSLNFLTGSGSPFAKRPLDATQTIPSVSLVRVIDTVQTAVSIGGVPPLSAGEVALFVPGVGHTIGSRNVLFVSDVSILNPQSGKAADDVKLYYTALTGSATAAKSTPLPAVPGQVSVSVADVVKSVFNGNDEVGSLQIRSKDTTKLAVAATVLTANNSSGTFGNTIPVFRSDRSIGAGSALVLTGLRKDATTHTNLYIQETAGAPATVQIDFIAADGSTVGSRPPDALDAFKILRLFDAVPANAVAAVVNNTSTAGGKVAGYATPVDEASTDTWAIADWSAQLGYASTQPVIIPVAGTVHGANNTFYRTDVAITNRGTTAASGTLRYVSRIGEKIDRQVSLGGKQTSILTDVVGAYFNVTGDSTGYLTFTPVTGSFAVSSRTFTIVGGKADTFGTGVPVMAATSALANGGSKPIAGLSDSTRSTVVAARPGTFRTNFAIMETTGNSVRVRVTFRFTFPAGAKVQGIGSAVRDYSLNPNQFLLLNSIAGEILGVDRLQFGDLTNVEADFQVLSGNGAVLMFTSSVDNATGDSILRTE